jgi:hypothetical protein
MKSMCPTTEWTKSMSNYLLEYMKIHLVSLEQDQADVAEQMESLDPNSKDYAELDFEYNWLGGQIIATRHFIQIGEEHAQ